MSKIPIELFEYEIIPKIRDVWSLENLSLVCKDLNLIIKKRYEKYRNIPVNYDIIKNIKTNIALFYWYLFINDGCNNCNRCKMYKIVLNNG